MTLALLAKDVIAKMSGQFPGVVAEAAKESLLVPAASLPEVAAYLKTTGDLEFDYLNFITAVDYYSYFEVVYHLTSTRHNHSIFLKVRLHNRVNPVVPSVVALWQGADFQEREIFDLFGIKFEGHPNLKRIVLWDGFNGHPLRKDFIKW